MKILLINIPLRPELPLKLFPIGLGYIATAMKNDGWDFDLLDLDILRWSDEKTHGFLRGNKYDVVCMGCMVTGYKHIKRLSKVIKSSNPECKVIVGNSVATSIPDLLLTKTMVDVAVMGEGDEVILELLDAIKYDKPLNDVSGVYFKDGEKIVKTNSRLLIKDISTLPNINFDLFDVEEYIKASHYHVKIDGVDKARALCISTARGCPHSCTFCYHVFKNERYRFRSEKSVVDEVIYIRDKYNLQYINFWDELTIFSRSRADKLSDELIKRNADVLWMGRCRANIFSKDSDVDIIKKMGDAGCSKIQYSLENGNSGILKDMNKNITVDQFKRQTELFHKAGVKPITSVIFGYPNETPDTIRETIDVCMDCGIYPSAGYLLPQPGSPMYKYALTNGFIGDEEEYMIDMGDRQDLLVNMTKMSDDEFVSTVQGEMRRCADILGVNRKDLLKEYKRIK